MVKLARQILQSSIYKAVPTDKDGGFGLVPRDFLDQFELPCDKYVPTCPDNIVLGEINAVCGRVLKCIDAVDPSAAPHVRKQCSRATLTNLPSKVIFNVKSHKEPGNVGFRIIHSSVSHHFFTSGRMGHDASTRGVRQV